MIEYGVDYLSVIAYRGLVGSFGVVGMFGLKGGISDRVDLELEEADCGVYGVERVIEGTNYSVVK